MGWNFSLVIFQSRFVSVCPSALSIGNVFVGQGHIVLADVTVGGRNNAVWALKFLHSATSKAEEDARRDTELRLNIVMGLFVSACEEREEASGSI